MEFSCGLGLSLLRMDKPNDERAPLAIGQRLELLRQVVGLSQHEFAANGHISAPHYAGIIKGEKGLGIDKARALVDAYHVTLDWIYDGDPAGIPYKLGNAIKALKEARETGEDAPKKGRREQRHPAASDA
jgi:transcriptional regulator with XRE-family HTH domain